MEKTRAKVHCIKIRQNQAGDKCILTVNTMGVHVCSRSAQPMAEPIQDAGNTTTLNRYAGAREGKCQRVTKTAVHMCQHNENKEVAIEEFDVVISTVFNFQ